MRGRPPRFRRETFRFWTSRLGGCKIKDTMPTLSSSTDERSRQLLSYIKLKLALLGRSVPRDNGDGEFADIASSLVARYREEERLLASYLCPSDQRIQTFLYDYLQEAPVAKLPNRTFVLDRPGLARLLSLPLEGDELSLGIIHSYRVKQGVLHNPKSDRRTTQGIFHVAEGGLPIPEDKQAVPKMVFAQLLGLAMTPPRELLVLPLTATRRSRPSVLSPCCSAPRCARKYPASPPKNPWKSVSSRPAAWSATSILWKAFSATPAIRICRKTTPRWMSTTGPATPVA